MIVHKMKKCNSVAPVISGENAQPDPSEKQSSRWRLTRVCLLLGRLRTRMCGCCLSVRGQVRNSNNANHNTAAQEDQDQGAASKSPSAPRTQGENGSAYQRPFQSRTTILAQRAVYERCYPRGQVPYVLRMNDPDYFSRTFRNNNCGSVILNQGRNYSGRPWQGSSSNTRGW